MSWFGKLRATIFIGMFGLAMTLSSLALANGAVIGDSIAKGTGEALRVATFARERMSSCWILQNEIPSAYFDWIVVSAGVNDAPGRCVAQIRANLHAERVIWIRPINSAGPTVDRVAKKYGDREITYRVGRDHLHPASYFAVASTIRTVLAEKL